MDACIAAAPRGIEPFHTIKTVIGIVAENASMLGARCACSTGGIEAPHALSAASRVLTDFAVFGALGAGPIIFIVTSITF